MATSDNSGGKPNEFDVPTIDFENPGDYGHAGMIVRDMSLRDHFAAQALAGLVVMKPDRTMTAEKYAAYAYELADAMIAAREGGQS